MCRCVYVRHAAYILFFGFFLTCANGCMPVPRCEKGWELLRKICAYL